MLVSDHASMNCGRSAGTIEYPARPRISAAHMAATVAVEGAIETELTGLTLTISRVDRIAAPFFDQKDS